MTTITVLFDIWYAKVENLKFLHRLGKKFITGLKENRLISLNKEDGYIHLSEINWTKEQLKYGISIKLKKLPFRVQLFKVVATNGNILKIAANKLKTTVYQIKQNLWSDYLRNELLKPHVPVYEII